MQIMPATGKWLASHEGILWTTPEDILFDPLHNIRLGSRYLSALIETFELEGGLAAYNGGGKRARRWLANNKADWVLWPETRRYVPFVLKLYDEFMEM
jgi:soluble lytic murein transglycosylase